MPAVWKRILSKSDFERRAAGVEAFNAHNKWKKRGIAITPVKYYVGSKFRDALVNVYSDGTVLVSHAGHEIGQGLNTKIAMSAAYALSALNPSNPTGFVPIDMIKIADINTDVMPNISMTGGSTTSEGCCASVMLCCEQLVERLVPVREKLVAKAKDPTTFEPTWNAIVAAAGDGISLSSQARLEKPNAFPGGAGATNAKAVPRIAKGYHNFGAAASEVEIDVLTGEMTILKTDLVYDCVKSLNPAIDLGQCE
eukprot:gene30955-26002_t